MGVWPPRLGPARRDRLAGHVNDTVYLAWFETVRVAYLHALEPSPYPELQTVIKSLTAEFDQKMNVNEAYIVAARTRSFRRSSFVQDYAVFAGTRRASGSAVVVLPDSDGRKARLPEARRRFSSSTTERRITASYDRWACGR